MENTLNHASSLHVAWLIVILLILTVRVIGYSNGILLQAGLWIIKKLFWLLLFATLLFVIISRTGHSKSGHGKPAGKSHAVIITPQTKIYGKANHLL
ncbi:hypothetical protein [Taibaiella koreensis]|uniref:hypothetical protein n=1 Tax=Taibaiella koreensis TaxID=1268548 RepID=UPI000E59B234|nr:hypothetical protein [Taibaiella koreensis]